MKEQLKINAVVFCGYIVVIYAIYCGGTWMASGTWPNGGVFGAVATAVGVAFGYAMRPTAAP